MASDQVLFKAELLDYLGVKGQVNQNLSVPNTATLASIDTAFATWAAAVDACVSGLVTGGEWRVRQMYAATAGRPTSAARISQTATLGFSAAGVSRIAATALPSIANSKIVAGKLNTADTQVVALIALLLGAVAGGTYTNEQGQSLIKLLRSYISFGNSLSRPGG